MRDLFGLGEFRTTANTTPTTKIPADKIDNPPP
jgi:hypothetical protein